MNARTTIRKGITPVVAIVMLLMLTVVVAGGAFAWMEGFMGDQTDELDRQRNTDARLVDLSCDASSETFDFFLTNSGDRQLNYDRLDVFYYNVSTNDLIGRIDHGQTGSLGVNGEWDSTFDVSASSDLLSGYSYRLEFEFTDSGTTVQGTCQG